MYPGDKTVMLNDDRFQYLYPEISWQLNSLFLLCRTVVIFYNIIRFYIDLPGIGVEERIVVECALFAVFKFCRDICRWCETDS
jgi:hypothetical protein